MFVSLSLLEAGYTVFANADASGTFDVRAADNANARMREAGVYVMPQFAVAADLQRDWRNPPGIPVFLDLLFKYVYFCEGPDVSGSLLIQPQVLPHHQQRYQAARWFNQARCSHPRRGSARLKRTLNCIPLFKG